MRITNIGNISFQKILMANCHVGNGIDIKEAKIYRLEYPDDEKYYIEHSNQNDWQNSFYLQEVQNEFIIEEDCIHYVMEDTDGATLCIGVLDESRTKENKLDYLETAPKLSSYNRADRKIKYIGETMLAFLVKITKGKKNKFEIPDVAQRPRTIDFYSKICKFNMKDQTSAYLERNEFDRFIKQNEKHTGSEIEII